MQKLRWFLMATIIFSFAQAKSETLEILTASPTNDAPITLNLAPCSNYSVGRLFGTQTQGDQINIYASLYYSYFDLLPCSDSIVEVGPFASGNYTLNYYASEDGDNFVLHDSKPIVIEKSSDNEPPMGRIILSGEAVEDRPVTVAEQHISDADGMGEISYQWYRNDQPIPGARFSTYVLSGDDSRKSIHVEAIYVDGLGKEEHFSSLLVGAPGFIENIEDQFSGTIYISGNLSIGSTLTIHNGMFNEDGMRNVEYSWSRLKDGLRESWIDNESDTHVLTLEDLGYQIEAMVTCDAGIGHSTTRLSNISGEVASERYAPVISPPDNLVLPATGVLTLVDPGMATAHDVQDGNITPVMSTISSNGGSTLEVASSLSGLSSGNHILTWKASDSSGNAAEAMQLVSIEPIIEFSSDQNISTDDFYNCPITMSGMPAKYPVRVPYSLTGVMAADRSERLLYGGTLIIDSHKPSPSIPVFNSMIGDAADYESLRLDIGTSTNAVLGDNTSCEIVLSNDMISPRVALNITQNDKYYRVIYKHNGRISVTATIPVPASNDTPIFDWSASDSALFDIDTAGETFTIDPSRLEPGVYRVRVTVSQGPDQFSDELSFLIVDLNPAKLTVDSDLDGVLDYYEDTEDSDRDGIPDYLDHFGLPANILQQEELLISDFLIEAERGLTLLLGDTALYSANHGVLITQDDITNSGLGGADDSNTYPYQGGLFDFRIKGLIRIGDNVKVVIPQRNSIDADSIFRLQMPGGWQTFREDDRNAIKSTAGVRGLCPAPGDESFTDSLTSGDWCVELTIEDGGPNDADGQIDGKIVVMGGVTTGPTDNAGDGSNSGDGSGGGGVFNLWTILLLALYSVCQSVQRRRYYS